MTVTSLVLTTPLRDVRYYAPRFTGEQTEVQRGGTAGLRLICAAAGQSGFMTCLVHVLTEKQDTVKGNRCYKGTKTGVGVRAGLAEEEEPVGPMVSLLWPSPECRLPSARATQPQCSMLLFSSGCCWGLLSLLSPTMAFPLSGTAQIAQLSPLPWPLPSPWPLASLSEHPPWASVCGNPRLLMLKVFHGRGWECQGVCTGGSGNLCLRVLGNRAGVSAGFLQWSRGKTM